MTDDRCISGDVIGEHEWAEKEVRVHLDSRTYRYLGQTYTWECVHCGAYRRETVSGEDRVLQGPTGAAGTPPSLPDG